MPTTLVVTGNMYNVNIVTIAWVSLFTGAPLPREFHLAQGVTPEMRSWMDSDDKLSVVKNSCSFIAKAWNLLIYIGGAREYMEPGKKTGDDYSIGKKL